MEKIDKSISRLSIKQSIALRRLTKTEVIGNKSFKYQQIQISTKYYKYYIIIILFNLINILSINILIKQF